MVVSEDREKRKQGFTLMEVVVVLVILAIVAAIAIPTASNYIKLAEFRKNEANAKTAYLAAESVLTWYRTSGEWKDFRTEIIENGIRNETFAEDDARAGRIYAVMLNSSSASARTESEEQAMTLLEECGYDKEFLQGAIAVEIDVDTGSVYSAFYATRCQGLSYEADNENVLDISAREGNRAYDQRKGRLLGYYSTEDVANVVELKPVQLKVTSINLVNSETLSLNWSSNSRHDNRDVNFHITFYQKENDAALFSAQVNRSDLVSKGWSGSTDQQMASLALTKADGTDLGTWEFPMLYLENGSGRNGRFSLILDGMMSASLMESLKANPSMAYAQTSSTSITRLGMAKDALEALKSPQDIYAVIEAEPDYEKMLGDLREYKKSLPVTSNTENTLFAKAAVTGSESDKKLEAEITRFRHLSNIRYIDKEQQAEFTITERIDWTAAGAGLYDNPVTEGSMQGVRRLQWKSSVQTESVLDVPSIALLSKKHVLTGTDRAALVNVQLGPASMPGDADIEELYKSQARPYTHYLGLFCEVEGTIEHIILQNPALTLTGGKDLEGKETPVEDLKHLYGAGILCGRSQGRLEDISVKVTDRNSQTVAVYLADREAEGNERDKYPAGIGGLVGVLAGTEEDGTLIMLTDSFAGLGAEEALIKGLFMEGTVTAELPNPLKASEQSEGVPITPEEAAEGYAYGIGGIFGYAWMDSGVSVADCENHANVTGNLFTGGIGGRVSSNYIKSTEESEDQKVGLVDCFSDGLVLCAGSAAREEEVRELTGRYFGGILGYGSQVKIDGSASASGRSKNYEYMKNGYTEAEKKATLLGQYVGGIIGYGNACHLKGCGTQRGGYILGSDYVGGIAGGLSNDIGQVITGAGNEGSAALTTNEGYVIGNSYVGGIVGKNEGESETVVRNCVNNGVVAGYGYGIGGIVGYNGSNGVLEDCASYLSDYDHSIYQTIVEKWQTEGECVGGLAGYNNGRIIFEKDADTTIKSVSSIVTGKNFVGGIIGFNDTEGRLEANYELVGGQIYASGTGAGGAIGLNTSVQLLGQTLTVRPVSVTGTYGTGGIIGANVVNLTEDTTIDHFKASNSIGSISGTAFTGGIIGYQRTYREDQILPDVRLAGQDGLKGSSLFQYLLAEMDESFTGKALLPRLDENSFPTMVIASSNSHSLTITNAGNDAEHLEDANNNIPIQGYAYIGGIVGYCERNSLLVLANCKNSAGISRLDSQNREGISLKTYLQREGMKEAANQIEGDPNIYMIGGIIGLNMENQIIDHCANTGNIRGFQGLGGIVGFNAGGVFNCELSNNFGNAELDYIGGIAGLNICADTKTNRTYSDVKNVTWSYTSGTIGACTAGENRSISGRNYVGGIVGSNLSDGFLTDNICNASVRAAGSRGRAGGIAGDNAGAIQAAADSGVSRNITGTSGEGIGGLVGYNRQTGVISVKGSKDVEEVIAVSSGVTITGRQYVGGIVGINEGTLKAEASAAGQPVYLTAQAKEVRALLGYAGGIAGEARGTGAITNARNRSLRVTANRDQAGGIVAVNGTGMTLRDCQNLGDVNSDAGYAGGIAAENLGTIENCQVGGKAETVTINSYGVTETGAVCAVNRGTITITDRSPVLPHVELTGNAKTAGGVAGVNEGTISGTKDCVLSSVPKISLSGRGLSIGGVAGENRAQGLIQGITASGLTFKEFQNYRYLGGIVGENKSEVSLDAAGQNLTGVRGCKFVGGTITEGSSAVGNCYGGIAGDNYSVLEGCEVEKLNLQVTGVYTATSTSTAREKEESATHAGGIAGKNEEGAEISRCFISKNTASTIHVDNGMAGGIAGYNKGMIRLSGDAETDRWMSGVELPDADKSLGSSMSKLRENTKGLSADEYYVNWDDGGNLDVFPYNSKAKITVGEGRDLILTMKNNGNLGGITAYNAPTGILELCATGNWYLKNSSAAIGVGTGGIIGMNESEQDLSFLLNRAFVGRQLTNGATDRFAGGIIGNQNNTTLSGWKIQGCINYGTVYGLKTHYSGGIVGQWTGSGGTIERCYNYGNLQTTYFEGWKGASGGIVAQLYHAYENNEYNIISCGNYGNIYGKDGRSLAESSACDSAGILGNITAYLSAQTYTIQVLDCVNGSGVEIYSASMSSGIVGFFSCDQPEPWDNPRISTENISLRIERCRNFAYQLSGANFASGIFGERYGAEGAKNTALRDCYSVSVEEYNKNLPGEKKWTRWYKGHPIISYRNGTNEGDSNGARNSRYLNDKEKLRPVNNNINNYYIDQNKVTHITGSVPDIANDLKRTDTSRAFIIDKDGGEYLAYLAPGNRDVNGLTLNNDILYSENTEVGKILFKIVDNPSGQHNDMASQIVNRGSDFDDHVRSAYHKLEDEANSVEKSEVASKMKSPTGVTLTLNENKVTIKVTPTAGTDPFRYKARLELGGGVIKTLEFYSEEYSFELSSQEMAQVDAGSLKAAVSACSMYDEVADSELISSDTQQIARILPDPSIRILLIRKGNNDFAYRFRLDNIEDYKDFIPQTGDTASWKIQINGTTVEISPKWDAAEDTWNMTSLYTDSVLLSSDVLQQLRVQAVALASDDTLMSSRQVSVPVYLPSYKPSMSLTKEPQAKPDTKVLGDNLTNLSIMVTLDASGADKVTTPPIYRADLIGTWDDPKGSKKENIVMQSTDLLASATGSVSAVFHNLPEYMTWLREDRLPYVTDLKVRVWYAQSGLGPVYTYDTAEENGSNICLLDQVEKTVTDNTETITPIWSYMDSPVLDNNNDFADYRTVLPAEDTPLFQWIAAPNLEEEAELSTEQNRLQYTFRWDQDAADIAPDTLYIVSLAGIQEDGTEVSILTNREVEGRERKVDAEDWSYESVKLTVIRRGVEGKEIGLTASREYTVKQRLPRPAQPVISNPDTNELNYTIEWLPVVPETGCASYEVYVQPYKEDGSLEEARLAKTVEVSAKKETGTYETDLSLENYAGRKVLVYLVACPETDHPLYARSVDGVTYELEVPGRIPSPTLRWTNNWKYASDQPVSVASFEAEETSEDNLQVTTEPDTAPPGDSSYLLKAYVFDSEEQAQAAVDTLRSDHKEDWETLEGLCAVYPAQTESILVPVSMTPINSLNYQHILQGLSAEYAGKWLLTYARVSSGDGQISSHWVPNQEIWQLPYVKLSEPTLQSGSRELIMHAKNMLNPDIPQEEEWNAAYKTVSCNSLAPADTYYMTLTPKGDADVSLQKRKFRIQETKEEDADGGTRAGVQVSVETEDDWIEISGEMAEDAKGYSFDLTDYYSMEVSGTYQREGGLSVSYTVTAGTKLEAVWDEERGFTYTLILPDADYVETTDGNTISEVSLRPTASVSVYADVKENDPDRNTVNSPAYVWSEESSLDFAN